MAYWLMRSEPDVYGWDHLVKDDGTEWDGVRNYTARNFLKEMKPGDLALFYHSNKEKAAVGVMERAGIMALPALDPSDRVAGVVHLHDLMRAGAV